jgi:integrase/recombinase XerD
MGYPNSTRLIGNKFIGSRLNPKQVFRIVRAAALRVGIDQDVSPHWLRHCHGSHAAERGVPLPLIARTLGHKSLATTSRYLHARPQDSSGLHLPV